THTLTFSATYAVTQVDSDNPDLQIDVTWALDNPAIQVALHEAVGLSDANHITFTITEFSITRGAEAVSMHGTIAITLLSPTTESVSFNLTIDVNDVPWIRIRGTDNGLTVLHAEGSQLSHVEANEFVDLFTISI